MGTSNSGRGSKVACNCGKSSGEPAESYVVRKANGQTEEVSSKVAADILVTKHGGSYTVKKK
jgi:hypothetical protein